MKRGNLLWTGSRMMLSEHRQRLNERIIAGVSGYELERALDEQQYEEWQEIWAEAVNNRLKVTISYHSQTLKEAEGYIKAWDLQAIYLQQGEDDCIKISFNKIIDLKLG